MYFAFAMKLCKDMLSHFKFNGYIFFNLEREIYEIKQDETIAVKFK